jgi:catechol 2,3-dioxygenase-like lactoylglutathione lyase family enzyme
MQVIQRQLINLVSENLEASKAFYTTLFNFKVEFDSDWFIQLKSEDGQFELGIIKAGHEIVPDSVKAKSDGMYITFVVESTDEAHTLAKAKDFTVLQAPVDTFYGQRRLLLRDPNDAVIDISSVIK